MKLFIPKLSEKLALDFFRNSIRLLKWSFLAGFLINFSTICMHMLSKFIKKPAQKFLIFPIKANFERSLLFFLMGISASLLSSCGYHLGTASLGQSRSTFYVPYAKGDPQGAFTQVLVHKLSASSPLRYARCDADLEVKVVLGGPVQRNIGFMYAPKNPQVTAANEGRLTQKATVTVVDCGRGCTVMGPTEIMAWVDYDFETDMGTVNRNSFSLGQLAMNPLAKDAATAALYGLLAEKIVDYVNHSW